MLSEPPPEVRFLKPATGCERIPIEKLGKMKTVSPLLNADFNAVDPKIVHREDRFWYVVPPRPKGQMGKYYQENSDRMVMCYACSNEKAEGKHYDVNEQFAGTCPNCASNFCRGFLLRRKTPAQADIALRWAASVILQEQKDNPKWEKMQPGENIREWMWKTIITLKRKEALGDCVEICLGVLRTALMYEGCGSPLFNWKDINGVFNGLEICYCSQNLGITSTRRHPRSFLSGCCMAQGRCPGGRPSVS